MAKKIENVYVIGMGALGMLFAGLMEDRIGRDHVAFLMDDERYASHLKRTHMINGTVRNFRLVRGKEASCADLILVATKATGLSAALETMENAVGEDTLIASCINGITSEEILGARFGRRHVIHTVAQGMDAVCFHDALTYRKPGILCVGTVKKSAETGTAAGEGPAEGSDWAGEEELIRLTAFFDEAGVPYQVEENILSRLWSKFMLNCGCNQTCMVYDCGYGGMMAPASEAFMAMTAAMREVVVLANLEGIPLSEKDIAEYLALMRSLDPEAMPSMEQDRVRKKKTEVEIFAGTVKAYAKKHGIEVPAADFLYRRIREIETAYGC